MSIFYVPKGRSTTADPSLKVTNNFLPPGFFFPNDTPINRIVAILSSPPVGSDAILEIKNGTTTIATITITDGSTTANAYLAYTILADTLITVDVTQVGATEPGKNLDVLIVNASEAGGTPHDHDTDYAAIGHNHEGDYAAPSHEHSLDSRAGIVIGHDGASWSGDAPARSFGENAIKFISNGVDPADPTNGIATPANIIDGWDTWLNEAE